MSIETEITRISTNVSDTLSAVSEMGGEVPEGATSNDMAAGVRSIPVGAKIDDTTPSSTTVYSSQKIESVVSALNEANATQDERLTKLENTTPSGSGGLTAAQINALDGMFKVAAYVQSDVSAQYQAFKDAFGIVDAIIPATSITLSAATLTFDSLDPQTITATVAPSDTTDSVVWKSSSDAVATVEHGVVTPIDNGTAMITATAGDVSATCIVNVEVAEDEPEYVVFNYYFDTQGNLVASGGSSDGTNIGDISSDLYRATSSGTTLTAECTEDVKFTVVEYDSAKNVLTRQKHTTASTTHTFTLSANTHFIRIGIAFRTASKPLWTPEEAVAVYNGTVLTGCTPVKCDATNYRFTP